VTARTRGNDEYRPKRLQGSTDAFHGGDPFARCPRGAGAERGKLDAMPTLVLDPAPAEIKALLERRHSLGLDSRDEVWEGTYRMIPPPSFAHQRIAEQLAALLGPLARAAGLEPLIREFGLGEPEDYRVPDGGLHRPGAGGVWYPTAALVLEILSPGDETWQKLPFYAAHGVDELLIVDPQERAVHWLARRGNGYESIERSTLIDLEPGQLVERIDWP
jgi:Uma2 family endonuclease